MFIIGIPIQIGQHLHIEMALWRCDNFVDVSCLGIIQGEWAVFGKCPPSQCGMGYFASKKEIFSNLQMVNVNK